MSKGFDVNVKTDRDRYVIPSDSRARELTLNLEKLSVRFEVSFHWSRMKSRVWDEEKSWKMLRLENLILLEKSMKHVPDQWNWDKN